MFIQSLSDTLLLLALGLLGWMILAQIRVPAPEVLGPAALIGALRVMEVDLPYSPLYIFPLVQILIGIFIGSMVNRETIRKMKAMAFSALIVIFWAISIIFLIGFFLARYTALDLYTAMLSASMGGLPEITIIAIASGASVAVIVMTQMLRLIGTVLIIPLILNRLNKRKGQTVKKCLSDAKEDPGGINDCNGKGAVKEPGLTGTSKIAARISGILNRKNCANWLHLTRTTWARVLLTLAVAAAGGLIFDSLRVPAGLLVGSTLFIALLSVAGVRVSGLRPWIFDLLLVFIGINIADNITSTTVATVGNREMLIPILIATTVIFATSFGVSLLIHRLTGWDYATCFLAAAPGGFTMMTALAIKHGLNPLRVSMLHLCRLLSINLSLPFIFMLLMGRH